MTEGKDTPARGFHSDVQDLLLRGSKAVIRVDCKTREAAIQWRARMHRLRLAMRRENHPDWALMYGATVRIDRSDPSILIVQPVDYEFVQAIKKAFEEDPTLGSGEKLGDDFLKSLMEGKEKP
jgi:hypothetical protein